MHNLHAISPNHHVVSCLAGEKNIDLSVTWPVVSFCCCHRPLEWASFSACLQLWNEEGVFFFLMLWIDRLRGHELPKIRFKTISVHMCFFSGERVHSFLHFFFFLLKQSLCPRQVANCWSRWFLISCPSLKFYDSVAVLKLLFLSKMTVKLVLSWMIYFLPNSKTHIPEFA